MTPKEAADYLNDLWTGYDENNDTSPLGVTLTLLNPGSTSFYSNIFCGPFNDPWNPFAKKNHTGCHVGGADCRLSTSIYSHKYILEEKSKMIWPALQRMEGVAFNQERIENRYAKCSYLWDGATQNKKFRGCGPGGGADCSVSTSAFANKCADGKTCTWDSPDVKAVACQGYGGQSPPPAHFADNPCFFPGPAIAYGEETLCGDSCTWQGKASDNKLRDMIKWRMKYNNGSDGTSGNIRRYNEVVLDQLLMLPDMQSDPASVVTAFLFSWQCDPNAHWPACPIDGRSKASMANAIKMSEEFAQVNGMGSQRIPVIGINRTFYSPKPFFVPAAADIDGVGDVSVIV